MSSTRPVAPLPSRANSQDQRHQPEEGERGTLAAGVYQQVWTEFYEWKIEESRRLMAELMVIYPKPHENWTTDDPAVVEDDLDEEATHSVNNSSGFPSVSRSSSHGADHLDEEMAFLSFRDLNVGSRSEVFTLTTYREESHGPANSSYSELETYKTQAQSAFTRPTSSAIVVDGTTGSNTGEGIDSTFLPHPRYYFCTPTSRNLVQTDGRLHFSLFEDDPEFDLNFYLKGFQSFVWQVDFLNPDIEMIQLETIRRLHYAYSFSFESIDTLGLFVPIRRSPCSGLLWDTSQRDLLRWPGMQLSEQPELGVTDLQMVPMDKNIFAHVKNGIKTFCPNLNCLRSFCDVHRDMVYPEFCSIKPVLKAESLRLAKGNKCGVYCFRLLDMSDEATMEAVHWDNEDDVELLRSMLHIIPDTLPCDLATILRAKCRDVFVYRSRLLPDEDIEEDFEDDEPDQLRQLPVFNDEPKEDVIACAKFSPLPPCNHKGPCSRDSGCLCFLKGHHCQRNCRCDLRCYIRWKGCRCNPEGLKKKACSTYYGCPCRAVARECDPELCTKCDARIYPLLITFTPHQVGSPQGRKHKHRVCANVDSQRSQYPLLEIKRGSFGLGAFATSVLRSGQFIGEYTGEVLYKDKDTELSLSQISEFTKLNYKYDLNEATMLDSMCVGNEMRYLNHEGPPSAEETRIVASTVSRNKGPNCAGKVVYTNNDHKILLHALRRIEDGSELFLDYGETYWATEGKVSDQVAAAHWR